MITRNRKTPSTNIKPSDPSKKNESLQNPKSQPSSVDDYLEALMKQLAIESTEPLKQTCSEMRTAIPISYNNIPFMEKPKAIFMAGAPGSGKTHLINEFIPSSFKYALYNADIYQEHLLKVNGLYGNKEREEAIRNELQAENPKATKEELDKKTQSYIASIIATSMAISQKCMREDFKEMILKKLPIIIDRPGDRSSTIREDKRHLENTGYTTMMIMVYVSPITALKRNQLRERNVHPARLLDAWIGCMKQIATYKKLFGENFFLIQNDSEPFEITAKDLEPYLVPSKIPIYVKEIQKILKKSFSFSPMDEIRPIIQSFMSKQSGGRKRQRTKK